MQTVNMHEAKTNLSKLVNRREPFIIAKAGKPAMLCTPYEENPKLGRIGFLEGRIKVPENFDHLYEDEIAELFGTR